MSHYTTRVSNCSGRLTCNYMVLEKLIIGYRQRRDADQAYKAKMKEKDFK